MTTPDNSPAKAGFLTSLAAFVPKSLTLTGNPAVDGAIFKAIVFVAGIVGTWLYTHLKLTNPDYATYLTGAAIAGLVAVVTFVWGWFNSKLLQARSMNAAVTLKAIGASVPIAVPGQPGKITDKPITPATAQEIVKAFLKFARDCGRRTGVDGQSQYVRKIRWNRRVIQNVCMGAEGMADIYCDQEARDLAREAMAAIRSHDTLCTERWNQSRMASNRVEAALQTIQTAVSKRIGMTPAAIISFLMAALGFLGGLKLH